jgi:hypothetical protein
MSPEGIKMPIEAISLFPSFAAPDLGCFVRRKHALEIELGNENIHYEFMPSIDFQPSYHQVYFRVICGRARFFQRCFVYMPAGSNIPPSVLENTPPDWVLGGDYTPRPSDWFRYPTQKGERTYWFFGQHRNPMGGSWQADALVGHIYDIYENGTLSTVHYDDTGGDRDMNDLILEVAVVGRRSWGDLVQAVSQEAANKRFKKTALPKLKKLREQAIRAEQVGSTEQASSVDY